VNLVASATFLPSSRDHIVHRHPEWLMVPRPLAQELSRIGEPGPGYVGRLARWTRAQANAVEGLFLSPIVPAAAAYTVSVIDDVVRRYPIDGVHLDYIRYPGAEFDYSPLALAEFAAAVAPTVPAAHRNRLAGRVRDDALAWVDAYPEQWADFRRSRLTALVMKLRTAVRAVRPRLVVSAAVFPEARDAFATRFQDWPLWAANGLVDVLCPMAYTTELPVFRRQIEDAIRAATPARVYAGIGAYRLSAPQTVSHIEAARSLGAHGIVLFSYDALTARSADAYLDTIRRTAFTAAAVGQDEQR
jgi:uncharacterized lipoprotein YddW (UPF0748 family)